MDAKIFRLTGCMVVVSALMLSLVCSRVVGREDERPAGEVFGGDSLLSAENLENMSESFEGTVVEVIDAGRHIYVQVNTGEKRVWVAVPVFEGNIGDTVVVPPGVPSADFHSKTLDRDFEMIYFVGGIHRVDEGPVE